MKTRVILLAITASALGCTTSTSNLENAATPAQLPGYRGTYDRVFGAAVDAASMLSWDIQTAQKDAGVISAKTPMSLWTWGDKVTIHVFHPDSTTGDSLIHIGFTSGTDQAIDWGKNAKNQKKFFQKLDGILGTTCSNEAAVAEAGGSC